MVYDGNSLNLHLLYRTHWYTWYDISIVEIENAILMDYKSECQCPGVTTHLH